MNLECIKTKLLNCRPMVIAKSRMPTAGVNIVRGKCQLDRKVPKHVYDEMIENAGVRELMMCRIYIAT